MLKNLQKDLDIQKRDLQSVELRRNIRLHLI